MAGKNFLVVFKLSYSEEWIIKLADEGIVDHVLVLNTRKSIISDLSKLKRLSSLDITFLSFTEVQASDGRMKNANFVQLDVYFFRTFGCIF